MPSNNALTPQLVMGATLSWSGLPQQASTSTWVVEPSSRWLDNLVAKGDPYLRDEFIGFADRLLDGARNRAELVKTLRPSLRKKLSV